MDPLDKKFAELPLDVKIEVIYFIELLERKKRKEKKRKKKKLEFSWVGGLKELKDKYTSVELQHKINEWRI